MTRKSIYIISAIAATVITVILVAVCMIYAPIAAPVVAIVGGAVITWTAEKILSAATESLIDRLAEEEQEIVREIEHEHPVHTMIFRTHLSSHDVAGNHMVQETEEIITDDDGDSTPPPRPKKPSLPG